MRWYWTGVVAASIAALGLAGVVAWREGQGVNERWAELLALIGVIPVASQVLAGGLVARWRRVRALDPRVDAGVLAPVGLGMVSGLGGLTAAGIAVSLVARGGLEPIAMGVGPALAGAVTMLLLPRARPGRCVHCGYELIGALRGRCPECGRAGSACV